jgi:hypothetical protein
MLWRAWLTTQLSSVHTPKLGGLRPPLAWPIVDMPRFLTLCVCVFTLLAGTANADGRRISFTLRHTLKPAPTAGQVKLTIQIPQDVPGLQDVTSVRYSHKPDREFDENGDRYASYVFDNLDQPLDLDIDVDVDVFRYDLETARTAKKLQDPADVRDRFRGSEKFLETEAAEVQEALKGVAAAISAATCDDEKVRGVMDYVLKTLDWNGYNPGEVGAVGAFQKKGGDCSEFSDAFVALCRASGLPARVCEGYVTTPVAKGDTAKHAWAEVYHTDLGWVPFDPMWIETKSTVFEKRNPVYILFTRQRNHPQLANGHFASWTWSSGKVEVTDTYTIKSQADLPQSDQASGGR